MEFSITEDGSCDTFPLRQGSGERIEFVSHRISCGDDLGSLYTSYYIWLRFVFFDSTKRTVDIKTDEKTEQVRLQFRGLKNVVCDVLILIC